MTKHERFLRLFLRVVGSAALLALFCAFMPYSWMNAIHRWLGMGTLPDEPVVGYLARSASMFYALHGGLLWIVSCDLRRHHLVLYYLGGSMIFFGLVLLGVDLVEGMPLWWSLAEGPGTAAMGLLILLLSHRVGPQSD